MKKLLLIVAVLFSTNAYASDEPIIFPKDGQSKEQLLTDKGFCKMWAEEETGVSPALAKARIENINKSVTTDEQTKMGGLLEGVFKGAATGAVTGVLDKNIDNEVGAGAAKGAILGGMFKNEKQGERKEELEYRRESIEKEEYKEDLDRYRRAYTVCMEAKGYAVN